MRDYKQIEWKVDDLCIVRDQTGSGVVYRVTQVYRNDSKYIPDWKKVSIKVKPLYAMFKKSNMKNVRTVSTYTAEKVELMALCEEYSNFGIFIHDEMQKIGDKTPISKEIVSNGDT